MGTRGELLALVDSAPGGLKSLQAALTTWTDRALVAEVLRRQDVEAPPAGRAVAPLAPGGGDDYGDLDALDPPARLVPPSARRRGRRRRPPRRRRGDVVRGRWPLPCRPLAGRGPRLPGGERRPPQLGGHVHARDRAGLHPGRHPRRRRDRRLPVPRPAAAEPQLHGPGAGRHRGPAVLVRGGPAPTPSAVLAGAAAPQELRLHRDLAGIDHRIWFDAATGIVLRHEGSIDGEPCSSTALTDLVFDGTHRRRRVPPAAGRGGAVPPRAAAGPPGVHGDRPGHRRPRRPGAGAGRAPPRWLSGGPSGPLRSGMSGNRRAVRADVRSRYDLSTTVMSADPQFRSYP